MKKTFFSFLVFSLSFFVLVFSSYADTCQVDRDDDGSNPYSLRYVLETMLYDHPNPSCSSSSDSYTGADQLIKFKNSVLEITLKSSHGPLQLLLNKTFVIGDSDQTVLIKGRNLSSGTSPFDCISGSKSVYLRNLIIETNGIADIFSAESCLVQTDSVYVCDGTVNNTDVSVDGWCNGETWPAAEDDDDDDEKIWYYPDADGDGYGDENNGELLSSDPGDGYTTDHTDCDDDDEGIHPGAWDFCWDDIDQNCDGVPRECGSNSFALVTKYQDSDGDGYGDPATEKECLRGLGQRFVTNGPFSCDGYVIDNTDCDDSNAAVYPDATEECDDVDNNCDGVIDEESACPTVQCTDIDGDGYPAEEEACVADAYDCVDNNAEIYPGAVDTCDDGVDQNCSGSDCSAELCYDLIDNNEDGLTDCSDASCVSYTFCNALEPEASCVDALDDDGDGLSDCDDADCANLGVCLGVPETGCQDELDNDGDGLFDCDDTDCYSVVFDALTGDFCPDGGGSEPPPSSSSSGCGCYMGAAGTVNFSSVLFGLVMGLGMVVARFYKRPEGDAGIKP